MSISSPIPIILYKNMNIWIFSVNGKRKFKDEKFGFGGKKRGMKKNTNESSNDVSDYKPFRAGGVSKKLGKGNQRPGKDRRKQMKNKNKRKWIYISEKMHPVSVKDVDQQKFVVALAAFLKK